MTAYVAGRLDWDGMLLEDYADAVGILVAMRKMYPPTKWVTEFAHAASEASWEAIGPV